MTKWNTWRQEHSANSKTRWKLRDLHLVHFQLFWIGQSSGNKMPTSNHIFIDLQTSSCVFLIPNNTLPQLTANKKWEILDYIRWDGASNWFLDIKHWLFSKLFRGLQNHLCLHVMKNITMSQFAKENVGMLWLVIMNVWMCNYFTLFCLKLLHFVMLTMWKYIINTYNMSVWTKI